MRDPNTAIYFEKESINRGDINDMIGKYKTRESNATFIWTPNVGVYGINSLGGDFYRHLAVQEFEVILSELFNRKIKISIAD